VLAVATGAGAITSIDLSKMYVALPSIEESLDGSQSDLQLLAAGYVLAIGIALVPAGRLGDATSRRRVFLVGVIVMGVASVLGAVAPDPGLLILARMLQGLGSGLLLPQASGAIQQVLRGRDRALAFGYFGGIVSFAMMLGPTIGGLLLALDGVIDGWRWVFWINVPMLLVLGILAARMLPDNPHRSTTRPDLDPVGIVLLSLAVGAFLVPFVSPAGTSAARWLLLPVSVGLVVVFARWERRRAESGGEPLFRLDLFGIPSFRLGLVTGLTVFGSVAGLQLVSTLHLQQALGLSALLAGLAVTPFAVGSAAASWVAGGLTYRIGGRAVMLGSVLLLTGALVVLVASALLPLSAHPWAIGAGLLIAGGGGGMSLASMQTMMLWRVPAENGGAAASLAQVAQRIGSAVGIAVATAGYFAFSGGAAESAGFLTAIGIVATMSLVGTVVASRDRSMPGA
jgi:MFS family permease